MLKIEYADEPERQLVRMPSGELLLVWHSFCGHDYLVDVQGQVIDACPSTHWGMDRVVPEEEWGRWSFADLARKAIRIQTKK